MDSQFDSLVSQNTQVSVVSDDRESVRTTFNLSTEATEAKEWLSKRWGGITQKEVVDGLCDSMSEMPDDLWQIDTGTGEKERVRKTHVISGRARDSIERKASEEEIHRDDVLEKMLLFGKAVAEKRSEQQVEKHKKALKVVEDLGEKVDSAGDQLAELLDSGDPVSERFSRVHWVLEDLALDIRKEISDGTPVEPDPL